MKNMCDKWHYELFSRGKILVDLAVVFFSVVAVCLWRRRLALGPVCRRHPYSSAQALRTFGPATRFLSSSSNTLTPQACLKLFPNAVVETLPQHGHCKTCSQLFFRRSWLQPSRAGRGLRSNKSHCHKPPLKPRPILPSSIAALKFVFEASLRAASFSGSVSSLRMRLHIGADRTISLSTLPSTRYSKWPADPGRKRLMSYSNGATRNDQLRRLYEW